MSIIQSCNGCGQTYSIVYDVENCNICQSKVSYKCEEHPDLGWIAIPYCDMCEKEELELFEVETSRKKELESCRYSLKIWVGIFGYIFCFGLFAAFLSANKVINFEFFYYMIAISTGALCLALSVALKIITGKYLLHNIFFGGVGLFICSTVLYLLGQFSVYLLREMGPVLRTLGIIIIIGLIVNPKNHLKAKRVYSLFREKFDTFKDKLTDGNKGLVRLINFTLLGLLVVFLLGMGMSPSFLIFVISLVVWSFRKRKA